MKYVWLKGFKLAMTRTKNYVWIKANFETSRLWRQKQYGKEYPGWSKLWICRCRCDAFISWPNSYDVLIGNLFGDILTDEAGNFRIYGINAICICWQHFYWHFELFILSTSNRLNIANPLATFYLHMMFEDAFGLTEEAAAIRAVVNKIIRTS
jgi:3-isopropylmalate dehydrogenase